ncbi:sigma-54 interaction domain-containing protein [Modicisalibacter coralii]|uniref:sigma-54 interaction domain-containing protein n=1 Tax=Modicisalibacter coralii TaxID=2304602 RepID=UPI00100AFCA8|nr:sigma 54-interacting transcriptional regulator [Halomonas coralii]
MTDIDRAILDTIVETAHDHFFIVDAGGGILDVSPGSAAVYGLSREELRASTVQQLVERGVLRPSVTLEVLRTGRPAQLMQQTETGRRVVAEAYPVFVDGELVRVVSRSMDLTDLQLLQDEYSLLQQRFSDHLKRGAGTSLDDALDLDTLEVRSAVMREIALLLKRVAPTDATVLMLGESGVGKTAFARQLHRWSQRGEGPFIDVNCAAIPEALFESEMFGYQPGAFSGAARQVQTKLLKVIQDGRLTRLGDVQSRRVDFRLVVATNQDLEARVASGDFRLDLYYRLNVIPVTLPPLRERREDIPALVERCLGHLNQRYARTKVLHPTAWTTLMDNEWAGNVRELENWLERAWLASPGDVIGAPGDREPEAPGVAVEPSREVGGACLAEGETLGQAMATHERRILAAQCASGESTYAIARRLGISQPSVVRKLRKHGLRCGG